MRVVGDDSAPGHPVDAATIVSCGAFGFESGDVGCRGQTVEGHVDEQRVAASGSGARGGLEAFPIGAAGVVDVHVGIDEAGKNGGVAKIVELGVGGNLIGSDYVEQAFTFDKERGGTDPVWRYNSVGEKGAQNHGKSGAREQILLTRQN